MADRPTFDLFKPGELTAYARQVLDAQQDRADNIHRWLPYVMTPDVDVRFSVVDGGLVPEATFRQFGTQPDAGVARGIRRKVVELMPLSRRNEITERDQMRLAQASTEELRDSIATLIDTDIEAISERLQSLAGKVIATGSADIPEYGSLGQDFDRDADMEVTAAVLWDQSNADPLADLMAWQRAYKAKNKRAAGTVLVSDRAAVALTQRLTVRVDASLPLTLEQSNQVLLGQGLPRVEVFGRETFTGPVLPDHAVFLLPAAGNPTATAPTALGATYWGRTLSSTKAEFRLRPSEQPGVFAADYDDRGLPPVRKTFVDSLVMPVMTNANMAMRADVLAEAV